jgi:hypothetical protein
MSPAAPRAAKATAGPEALASVAQSALDGPTQAAGATPPTPVDSGPAARAIAAVDTAAIVRTLPAQSVRAAAAPLAPGPVLARAPAHRPASTAPPAAAAPPPGSITAAMALARWPAAPAPMLQRATVGAPPAPQQNGVQQPGPAAAPAAPDLDALTDHVLERLRHELRDGRERLGYLLDDIR